MGSPACHGHCLCQLRESRKFHPSFIHSVMEGGPGVPNSTHLHHLLSPCPISHQTTNLLMCVSEHREHIYSHPPLPLPPDALGWPNMTPIYPGLWVILQWGPSCLFTCLQQWLAPRQRWVPDLFKNITTVWHEGQTASLSGLGPCDRLFSLTPARKQGHGGIHRGGLEERDHRAPHHVLWLPGFSFVKKKDRGLSPRVNAINDHSPTGSMSSS